MTSKTLTLARDLQRRKSRERHGLFVAEGVRSVEELFGSKLSVRGVLVAPGFADSLVSAQDINESGQITGRVFEKSSGKTLVFVATPIQ